MGANDSTCPACRSGALDPFYRLGGIPLQSCVLLDAAEPARSYPTGELELCVCRDCSFIFNSRYDPALQGPLGAYEASQAHSPRFVAFMDELCGWLLDAYDLRGKRLLEIGCGGGDFLRHICRAGGATGAGFDPTCRPSDADDAGVTLLSESYGDAAFGRGADAIFCRHTLEHIPDVLDFMRMVRRACDAEGAELVCFEVPDTLRVLEESAFWDVYYEHCSYFCRGSLERLFAAAGFAIEETRLMYDEQYLVIVARPAEAAEPPPPPDRDRVLAGTGRFALDLEALVARWSETLAEVDARGGTAVVWGAGSKAAGFFAAGLGARIDYIVDVNPRKQGMFQAGSGQEIIAPERLVDIAPDTVILMNPIYREEIGATLRGLGLSPHMLAL